MARGRRGGLREQGKARGRAGMKEGFGMFLDGFTDSVAYDVFEDVSALSEKVPLSEKEMNTRAIDDRRGDQ